MPLLPQATAWVKALHPALLACAAAGLMAGCLSDGPTSFSGYAEADLVYLAASGGGVLQQLPVHRGDHVASGAPLFELDAAYEAYGRDAAQAQQQRAQAKAALTMSSSQLQRQRELVKQGFVSAAQMDDLEAARSRDQARVKELEAQLALARTASRPDTIAAAKADVRAASAQLSQQQWASIQKQRSAPVAATVYDVLYRQGEWVPPGQPVVVVLPDQGVKVRFFVPQAELARAKVGQLVQVSCDQCPGGQARVRYVSPQAEFTPPVIYSNESRGKLVYLIEASPEGALLQSLKPGQPLTVRWAS